MNRPPTLSAPVAGRPPRPPLAVAWVAALAAMTLLAHVATNARSPYEFHRDEFLYMAMGEHLRLWRMDFPPFIAIVSRATRAVLGDSLVAVRLLPALAGALLVVLAALVARELGGRRGAQALAALAVATSPLFLRPGNLFQPVVFDQLWWTVALFALVRLGAESPDPRRFSAAPRWWLVLGAACGVGLLTKFSMLFFGAGLAAGLVLAPQRRVLATRWPWLVALVTLVIGSPSITGQLALGFPVVGQMGDLRESQLAQVSAWSFATEQLLFGPGVALAAAGVWYLLRGESTRPFRAVAWTCVAAWLLLLALHGKAYYIGPIYPTLIGAGAAALDRWAASPRVGRAARLGRGAAFALVVAYGALTLPLGLPILPPPRMTAYAARLGVTAATTTNRGEALPLPQDYADMLGWREQVAAVARVYDSLPPATRAHVVLVGENYGEAGALDFYGPRHGLPRVVSAAGSFWFFGPGERPGRVVLSLGGSPAGLAPFFRRVTEVARVTNPWGVPEERDVPIFLCEDPPRTLQAIWPGLAGRQ